MTEQTYQHAEAYCLMTYKAEQHEGDSEVIWNSRDGVTPFVISLRNGKTARHINWASDVRVPDHKPAVGDRIFVDLTWEDAQLIAARQTRQLWDAGLFGGGHPSQLYESYEAFLDVSLRGMREEVDRRAPHVVEVTEEMARERGWL